jgi:hypothetical protein
MPSPPVSRCAGGTVDPPVLRPNGSKDWLSWTGPVRRRCADLTAPELSRPRGRYGRQEGHTGGLNRHRKRHTVGTQPTHRAGRHTESRRTVAGLRAETFPLPARSISGNWHNSSMRTGAGALMRGPQRPPAARLTS